MRNQIQRPSAACIVSCPILSDNSVNPLEQAATLIETYAATLDQERTVCTGCHRPQFHNFEASKTARELLAVVRTLRRIHRNQKQ